MALLVIVLFGASFLLPRALDRTNSAAQANGAALGVGLHAGSPVPAFSKVDLLTGEPITADTIAPTSTLLFFSEGLMCQPCFEQIRDLQAAGAELQRRGIQFVSITPDEPGALRLMAARYEIHTPLIADTDRTMSSAFNTLGRGMHRDTPGHAFALVRGGTVRWYHDYWLSPEGKMYVPVAKILSDLPAD